MPFAPGATIVEAQAGPFAPGREAWRPDPTWPVPVLPVGIDRT